MPFDVKPPTKRAFIEFREPLNAGEYILKKKAIATFCKPYKCPGGPVVISQGDLLLLNEAKKIFPSHFKQTDLTVNFKK